VDGADLGDFDSAAGRTRKGRSGSGGSVSGSSIALF
jgi:hypothetical protein